MVDGLSEDVFLLLPRVLLEGRASTDGFGAGGLSLLVVGGLGLLVVEGLLEQVQAEEGGESSRNILPIGRRPPLYGMMLEQVS